MTTPTHLVDLPLHLQDLDVTLGLIVLHFHGQLVWVLPSSRIQVSNGHSHTPHQIDDEQDHQDGNDDAGDRE
jgi:hypothetical protein